MTDIRHTLQDTFRTVFDDDDLSITDATSAADIDGWDSMAHINLIIAIEKRFEVNFTMSEIASLGRPGKNVGDIVQVLTAKINPGKDRL